QIPAMLDDSKQYPLVVVLHGYGANGFVQEAYFGLNALPKTGARTNASPVFGSALSPKYASWTNPFAPSPCSTTTSGYCLESSNIAGIWRVTGRSPPNTVGRFASPPPPQPTIATTRMARSSMAPSLAWHGPRSKLS